MVIIPLIFAAQPICLLAAHCMQSEAHGRIIAYKVNTAAQPDKPFAVAASMSVPPGHFHLAPLNNVLFASHTGASKAFMLDRQGKIAQEFECAACHGSKTRSTGKVRRLPCMAHGNLCNRQNSLSQCHHPARLRISATLF